MKQVENMRVVVSQHGAPDVLKTEKLSPPEPATGEVRVRVFAAGVSAFDLIFRRWGRLPGSPRLPFVLGEDVVGVVDKLGTAVSSLELGEMVAGGTWSLGVGGGYSEFVCLPADDLVPVPAGVDPAEAVSVVVNYLTAHLHLHRIAEVRTGERLLVHGAAGGVGTAVIQLGRLVDLEMYGTASRHNHGVLSSLGVVPIDYRTEDFVESIRSLTGDGVDVAIDPIGGARQLWRSYRTLDKGGRLVWLGSAATNTTGLWVGPGSFASVFLLRLIPDGRRVPRCPTLGSYADKYPEWYRETLTELLDLVATGKITPLIAERVPLGEAAHAHELLERSGHAGKVVLVTAAYEAIIG